MSEREGELKGKHKKFGAFYIDDGVVADHLIEGSGPDVAIIFGSEMVNISQGYPSEKYGFKDRVTKSVKSDEDFQVDEVTREKIALRSPRNTITIRKGGKNVDQFQSDVPDVVEGLLRCPNSNCIANTNGEGVPLKVYHSVEDDVHMFRCHYCETKFDHDTVIREGLLAYL